MQKLNKNASILIWSVMLSLIITISFISISTKINKNIKLSWDSYEQNKEKISLDSALYNQVNTQLSDKKAIIFEDSNNAIISLKQWESTTLTFSGTTDFNVDLWIVEWWAVAYTYTNISSSPIYWVLNYSNSFSWTLTPTNNTGSLTLENIGWYSEILIKSENSFVSPDKKYKIVQTIWNNNFIKTRGTISN